LMSQNGIPQQRYMGNPTTLIHKGKIVMIRPNLR
jgi:hypothetical protein